MFYLPGSLFVGRIVELVFSVEAFPWPVPDWNDDDRRGAGTIAIGLAVLVGVGVGAAWLMGAF